MFKIESYVTPILLSYVDKYVRDFKPADAQVSLWGGGVVLHNLVLKADVLQKEVALPFTLVSGRIHELLIQVPWTKIMSESIVVTIDTIECVLSLNPPTCPDENSQPDSSSSRKTQVVEAPPGYMQALVRRIVSNIALRVHHLIVKYVQDDIVMSLNVKHLAVDSAGSNWEAAFADIDQVKPVIRRLVRLDDLTLCLDKADSDGKIRFYQEPLLYRCQLNLRVATTLVSANTRRATSLTVQLRSSKLAWSVTNEQLTLLLRLLQERHAAETKIPPASNVAPSELTQSASLSSAEPTRQGSWSDWAWSWLPTWVDREGSTSEVPATPTPLPIFFAAYLDDISVAFKVMELEGGTRKRARSVLEASANHAAVKSSVCAPTSIRLKFGARTITLQSRGKCVCGFLNDKDVCEEPAVYIKRIQDDTNVERWDWPEENFNDNEIIEIAQAIGEEFSSTQDVAETPVGDAEPQGEEPEVTELTDKEPHEVTENFWTNLDPMVYFEYNVDRSPPESYINPYDNPPKDFQYSDWVEECNLKFKLEPFQLTVCMGLIHRLNTLTTIYMDNLVAVEEPVRRTLTVEEREALLNNFPQRRLSVEMKDVRVRIVPWNHRNSETPILIPAVLDLDLAKVYVSIHGPMYPHRVCSAASQIQEQEDFLCQGARRHFTISLSGAQATITSTTDGKQKPCARAEVRLVIHKLLHQEYFDDETCTVLSYNLKIEELNICGSSARLQTALNIPMSLVKERLLIPLRYTTLVQDALNDEEAVALDLTLEDLAIRGYITKNVKIHFLTLQSVKVLALHEPKGGSLNQAWVFSGPDLPSNSPYLRLVVQYCETQVKNAFDYIGVWSEPTVAAMDPLLIAWLAYQPKLKENEALSSVILGVSRSATGASSILNLRRRSMLSQISQSSSGRRSGSGAELVHMRSRSAASSSEPSEVIECKVPLAQPVVEEKWWEGDRLMELYKKLKGMLVNIELGLVVLYTTTSTASALDCATMRDAMERHAAASCRVLAIGLGRLTVNSHSSQNRVWDRLRHDGPTFIDNNIPIIEAFPLKLSLADVSCYTLEIVKSVDRLGSQKSLLKTPRQATRMTVLDLFSTSLTLSVVTKSIQYKTIPQPPPKKTELTATPPKKLSYFKSGMEFKPTTLKEFIRGPKRSGQKKSTNTQAEKVPTTDTPKTTTGFHAEEVNDSFVYKAGPLVSLGVNIHADTLPLVLRLERDQLYTLTAALHGFQHIISILQRPPIKVSRSSTTSLTAQRSFIRSSSDGNAEANAPQLSPEESSEHISEPQDDINTIFDRTARRDEKIKLKSFFWLQWVVGYARLVIASDNAKVSLEIDDIISTVDLQTHYNQLKIKVGSARINVYERNAEEWVLGRLANGRVLEAREPIDAKEENNFLSVTITQALISNLPQSWKDELHPKLLEQALAQNDDVYEIFATLAPLEAILQPIVLETFMCLVKDIAPRSFCSLNIRDYSSSSTRQYPFCYVSAGGLRLLVTGEDESHDGSTDTFVFSIEKFTVYPHPENPILRRPVVAVDSSWTSSGNGDGRQYEINVKNVSVHVANFNSLRNDEDYTHLRARTPTAGVNPAFQWSQRMAVTLPSSTTTILFSVDICCVVAPAVVVGGSLVVGPAIDFNLVSDCAIEISMEQILLINTLYREFLENSIGSQMSVSIGQEKRGICPYAALLPKSSSTDSSVDTPIENNTNEAPSEVGHSMACDSGVETLASQSTRPDLPFKKSVSIALIDTFNDPAEFLEVYVTMGMIDISLYVADDDSPEVADLRAPSDFIARMQQQQNIDIILTNEANKTEDKQGVLPGLAGSQESIKEIHRDVDVGHTQLDFLRAPTIESNVHLIHVTLHQPNLYYWRKKMQRSLQVSLFNAWLGLGVGQTVNYWRQTILSTAKGSIDPETEIPPALITMKLTGSASACRTSSSTAPQRGTIRIDIERPVQIELSTDTLIRLKGIFALQQTYIDKLENDTVVKAPKMQERSVPFLYKWRRLMVNQGIESTSLHIEQISVTGSEGSIGWDSASVQFAVGLRPEVISGRALITALVVSAGPAVLNRHVLMQPLTLGIEAEATWAAWRRAEGGPGALEAAIRVNVEMDRIILDLRPADLAAAHRIWSAVRTVLADDDTTSPLKKPAKRQEPQAEAEIPINEEFTSAGESESFLGGQFYKDDLRSGAFKISRGGQLPMAYQVILSGKTVSWRYPHPRAITRIVAYPLPGQDRETDCVLEMYSPLICQWSPHTYFKIPVGEPRESLLYVPPPEAVFAVLWRFRACTGIPSNPPTFEFDIHKYKPKVDPLLTRDISTEMYAPSSYSGVTAEQLSGVLRVDSYFAPQLLPRTAISLRIVDFELFAHNSLPEHASHIRSLEGYYVSKPLMREHRVVCINARNVTTHANLGSPAGVLLVLDSHLSADVLDCCTGTMEQMMRELRIQAAISLRTDDEPKIRLATTIIHVAVNVPRLRTLQAFVNDWSRAVRRLKEMPHLSHKLSKRDLAGTKFEVEESTATILEGRVSLWLHNNCVSCLKIGQEGTDEMVPLGAGATLAYRWRSPTAPKRLRLAMIFPSTDWVWSVGVPFIPGNSRVRVEIPDAANKPPSAFGAGMFIHVNVQESRGKKHMHLCGRVGLANMLRFNLLYKVRAHIPESGQWQTVCSGDLFAETACRSVVCSEESEMVLKVKFLTHDTGWSGDIPLKECPKDNVPWLVKVPSEGDVPYVSVWCRVVRARSDGRILATFWPLYVLRSHLPLDTDALITTEIHQITAEETTKPAPLLQTTPGRGFSTHLLAPGTTHARHSLTFQYKNLECPVTREAVPLHYGVTDTSVFDKRTPVQNIDEVMKDVQNWLSKSGRHVNTHWPYSLVTKHFTGKWKPALIQPRCDVIVRYRAIHAGGGCCLEVELCPVVLLCNAASIPITLRAFDAAPLCRLESGCVISPPSAILKKPFFISLEMGRETFVSCELQVSTVDPGRYGTPPSGHVTLEHPANFSILCNHKVALLTMYYEIKEEINVLSISSTYVIINRLNTNILASAIAAQNDEHEELTLRPNVFKIIHPTKEGSIDGVPLCRFWLRGRWRGGDPSELQTFLCLTLPSRVNPSRNFLPIPVGLPPTRRAMALIDARNESVPITVLQMKHENRTLIIVAPDPCPQYVVTNLTGIPLAVGQPQHFSDEPSTSNTEPIPECPGTRWRCVVQPGTSVHYSTPSHCERFPPPTSPTSVTPTMTFLTFAKANEYVADTIWCAPVAVADGEQLVQLYNLTIKMLVHSYPHSSVIELQDVGLNDISASDIRRRLLDPFREITSVTEKLETKVVKSLERQRAASKIMTSEIAITESKQQLPDRPSAMQVRSALKVSLQQESLCMIQGPTRSADVIKSTSSIFDQICTPYLLKEGHAYADKLGEEWTTSERARCVVAGIVLEIGASSDEPPVLAIHLDRTALLIFSDIKIIKTILSIADVQIDNLQYESGHYDFAVVASTRAKPLEPNRWPSLWNMFADREAFTTRHEEARLLLNLQYDKWQVGNHEYTELTEVEIRVGTLALYIEDAYVTALVELSRTAMISGAEVAPTVVEERSIQMPLRLRRLHIHPLDLTLTLHTAVRMYIALDQSPLHLSAFKIHDMMTSTERLTHALTVHYLSAAILGAGWVVGGLELLGAPGALAARVGGATGGVRGVASAAAAALLRSLSAWAGSLARNLDLLAGDEEHARRAAAARRQSPPNFVAGLITGITNFAINILGAVGGLAHHPLVGVAVGETESGAAALRRGLLGALTKPLSATADLVAYAGHGLLRQTGWDPVPQRRQSWAPLEMRSGWRRDCVRWMFRLADLPALAGFEVLIDNAPLLLLLTHKFLVVADPDTERIVETIDYRYCTLGEFKGQLIELRVSQRHKQAKVEVTRTDEDDDYQISAAAMARVARYTGAEENYLEARVVTLLTSPGQSHSLYAALAVTIHHNNPSHFPLL